MVRKWTYGIYVLVWLIVPTVMSGQNIPSKIDSLKSAIELSPPGFDKLNALALLSHSLRYIDINSAEDFTNQLLDEAQELKDTFWILRAHHNLGIIHQSTGSFKKTDSLYHLALDGFQQISDSTWLAYVYDNHGELESDQGRFDKAIMSYFKSLEIHSDRNDSLNMAGALNKIGKGYIDLHDYPKALEFLERAFSIQKNHLKSIDYPYLLLNMAHCHFHNGQDEIGMALLSEAEILLTVPGRNKGLSELFHLKGIKAKMDGDFWTSLEYLGKALEIKKKLPDQRGAAEVRLLIAQVLYDRKSNDEAVLVSDTVLLSSYLLGTPDIELAALLLQAQIRAEEGKNLNRAILYKRYIKLSDSLYAVQKMEDLAKVENAFLLEETRQELQDMSKKDLEQQRSIRQNRLLVAGFVLLSLIIAIYSLILAQRAKTIQGLNAQLQDHKTDLEKMVRDRTHELEVAIKQVTESDKLKSYFLANLSHEIRTPLNGILGFSEILIDSKSIGEPDSRYVAEINKSGEHLLSIIDRILQLSKLQSGSIKTYPGVFEPRARLLAIEKRVLEMKGESRSAADIEIVLPESGSTPSLINTDQELIQEVLLHLISNALKFCSDGNISYGIVLKGPAIEFFVQDDGIGINKKDMDRIFTPFDHVEDVLTKTHRGIGLGLPLSSQIIYLLDSQLMVDSELGKGSRFYFQFPLYTAIQ